MSWRSKHAGILDVKGWGKAGASSSSNPYQDANHDPALENINYTDSDTVHLHRPAYGLDYKHSQMFRAVPKHQLVPRLVLTSERLLVESTVCSLAMYQVQGLAHRVSHLHAPVYTVDPTC